MMYAFPMLILAMLGYMFWHAGYRMRRDRIFAQRSMRRLREAAHRLRHSHPARRGLR